MEAGTDQSLSFSPHMGVLIPSPLMSHTHGVASHPFDPDALLTVKGRIQYLPEHAIDDFALEQQAVHNAGQVVVVREMAKLRLSEAEARRFLKFPELELNIHGNAKVMPLSDLAFWRKTLGWAGSLDEYARKQYNRYTTLLPGQSRLLQGVQDKYIWDHKFGEWKGTTHKAVQEAADRREWVCTELERIDALRYKVMADWKQNTQEGCMADLKKKRKRENEAPILTTTSPSSHQGYESDKENTATHSFKRPKTVSFINSITLPTEPTAKPPRQSIEPPFDIPPPELQIPGSQTTLSSLSTSPDFDHETRSQAPEPESPVKPNADAVTAFHSSNNKESTAASLARYTFLLDIPTTDNQRVSWLKFLDKYNWNPALISALRRFFMADPSPNTSQTKAFLERLKSVCGSIEVVESEGTGGEKEERYRLLWDRKVKVLVDEVAVESVREEGDGKVLRQQMQPRWLNTPKFSPIFSFGKHTPKTPMNSALTVSPSSSRVRVLESPAAQTSNNVDIDGDTNSEVDIQALMKQYVSTLGKGDRVEPPCDRCRELSVECRINKSSCRRCARRHDRCVWSEVEVGEVRALGLLGIGGVDGGGGGRGGGTRGARTPVGGSAKKGLGSSLSGGRVASARRIRKRSVYDFPEDGDETRGFLDEDYHVGENDAGENASVDAAAAHQDGDQTRAFLDCDGDDAMEVDADSGDEEEEDEWVPSS